MKANRVMGNQIINITITATTFQTFLLLWILITFGGCHTHQLPLLVTQS